MAMYSKNSFYPQCETPNRKQIYEFSHQFSLFRLSKINSAVGQQLKKALSR